MVRFAFDAIAYDDHVSDILFCLLSFFLLCVWYLITTKKFISLAVATFLWVHLITEMKGNRLYRNVIFLLHILFLIVLFAKVCACVCVLRSI